jgi:hypothetical protein
MSKLTISNVRRTTVRAFALGVISGGFIAAGTVAAFPAKATPDSQLIDIAIQEQPYICNALALKPSVSNLITVLATVQAREAITAYDSGEVVTIAVVDGCDRFIPVLERFVAIYAPGAAA